MNELLGILFFGGMLIVFVLVFSKPRDKPKRTPVYEKKVTPKPIKQPVSLDPIVGGCWVIDGDTIHICPLMSVLMWLGGRVNF